MAEEKHFKEVLELTRHLCEFIKGGKGAKMIPCLTFGISEAVATVHARMDSPDINQLDERADALWETVSKGGANTLSVKVFHHGVKAIREYSPDKKEASEFKDPIPDGILLRIELSKKDDIILRDVSLFKQALGGVVGDLLDWTTPGDFLFVNGEAVEP